MLYDVFTKYPVVAMIFIVLVIIAMIFVAIKMVQKIGLNKIRLYAYKWFEDAEYSFQHGDNEQKFEFVIQLARSHLPAPFNMFITESLLRKTVQLWFNLCKDFLDDGKLNNKEE